MKSQIVVTALSLLTTVSAFADGGTLYTCRWDNIEQDGFFTVLEGTEETAQPYYLVKEDETNYFAAKGSAQASNMSLEIRADMVQLSPPTYTLYVYTYNDSRDVATCWSAR